MPTKRAKPAKVRFPLTEGGGLLPRGEWRPQKNWKQHPHIEISSREHDIILGALLEAFISDFHTHYPVLKEKGKSALFRGIIREEFNALFRSFNLLQENQITPKQHKANLDRAVNGAVERMEKAHFPHAPEMNHTLTLTYDVHLRGFIHQKLGKLPPPETEKK